MRQHPIPQNVLDVEFKLFTKFTVKEFAYIATGIVIGAAFIYLWTENRIPGIVAFPSFAFFSGIGLILGLVPIQDQPADRILSNYIKAINRPTLRVWQGEEMKLKLKERKDAGKSGIVEIQQANPKQSNTIDAEEKAKLQHLEKLMGETGFVEGEKQVIQEKEENSIKTLVISKENISKYIVPNLEIQSTGTINMLLANKEDKPITNAAIIVKDSLGKPRIAAKSGARGDVLTYKKLEKGEYQIEIMHDQYSFVPIRFLVEQDVYPVIKINSI